ncbi:MAG: peptidylprolyl isomerase [Mariniblastus sp.]|nr:peptidylprolyl isomerase [Mariniblastus sp.]
MSCLSRLLVQCSLVAIVLITTQLLPEQGCACCLPQEAEAAKTSEAEEAPTPPETSPASAETGSDDLASLKKKWQALDQQIVAIETQYRQATDPTVQENIKKQYIALTEQANALVGQIKQAAETGFKADPNNQEAAKTLVGIMMNDAEFGRDQEALRIGDLLIQGNVDPALFKTAAGADRLSIDSKELFDELTIRQIEAKADDLPRVKLKTNQGEIVVELFENQAPMAVGNFVNLVENGFYNGLKFHRVIEGFMAQGGDPEGNGTGGPDYNIPCECYTPEARRHFTGSLSMAHAGRDTGGSQFFLTFRRTKSLDGKHTVFGRVIEGADQLDQLTRTYDFQTNQPLPGVTPDQIVSAEVIRKRDHAYVPTKVGETEAPAPNDPPPTQPGKTGEADTGKQDEPEKDQG